MTGVEQARQAFGARLREIRKGAGFSGVELAARTGWHSAKISRIEHGRQMPSDTDLVAWCQMCDARLLLPDLRAALSNVEALWAEWRRLAAAGHSQGQRRLLEIEAQAQTFRNYEPTIIPGLLQTEAYARAVLTTCIEFVGGLDDIDRAVSARLDRQRILRQGKRQITILLAEQTLYTRVGDDVTMTGQLEHLLEVMTLPRLSLGIVPRTAPFVYTTTCFVLFDRRMAMVETISAALTITQARELDFYEKAWSTLHKQAAYGARARTLIETALRS